MVCNHCGAEWKEGSRSCPFCGADNFEESYKAHQGAMDEYRRRENFWRSLPDKLAHKGMKLAVIAILAVLVIGLIGMGVAHFVGKAQADAEYRRVTESAAYLEELYQAGEYHRVAEEFSKLDYRYDTRLKKYSYVYQMDMYHGFATQSFEEYLQQVRDYQSKDYLYGQYYWFMLLRDCEQCEESGYLCDEEDMVAYYRSEADYYLKGELHLTDEDVDYLYGQFQRVEDPSSQEAFEEEMKQYIMDVYLKSLQ